MEQGRRLNFCIYMILYLWLTTIIYIPDSLILNLDQTKLKYISSTSHTLAKKGSKFTGIAGPDDKQSLEHSQFH